MWSHEFFQDFLAVNMGDFAQTGSNIYGFSITDRVGIERNVQDKIISNVSQQTFSFVVAVL